MRLSSGRIRLTLLFGIFLTSSFDIFMNLKIGGFSLRICYAFIMTYVLISGVRTYRRLSHKVPVILIPLILFTIIAGIFVFNTSLVSRNIGYYVWHILHVLFIISIISERREFLEFALKAYMRSFLLIAVFGILQFVLGLIGVDLLVTQWWMGTIPRVNGFCYEPSYFATYMLIGWTIFFHQGLDANGLLTVMENRIGLGLTTLAIILSSSRMGLAAILGVFTILLTIQFIRLILTLRIKKWAVAALIISIMAVVGLGPTLVNNYNKINFLFAGLGIANGSSHSKDQRMGEQSDVIELIRESPFIGCGLGGIPSARAQGLGIKLKDPEEAKALEGMNVHLEVFAQTGMLGGIFYIAFMVMISFQAWRFKRIGLLGSTFSRSLCVSLLIELLVLSMNQNILRAYLWIHIGVMAYYLHSTSDSPNANRGARISSL